MNVALVSLSLDGQLLRSHQHGGACEQDPTRCSITMAEREKEQAYCLGDPSYAVTIEKASRYLEVLFVNGHRIADFCEKQLHSRFSAREHYFFVIFFSANSESTRVKYGETKITAEFSSNM